MSLEALSVTKEQRRCTSALWEQEEALAVVQEAKTMPGFSHLHFTSTVYNDFPNQLGRLFLSPSDRQRNQELEKSGRIKVVKIESD
jgi:hypothetical protein